jgi:hypothetical protein
VRERDWKRLGVLLGVVDGELGAIIAAWPSLSKKVREAVVTITAH